MSAKLLLGRKRCRKTIDVTTRSLIWRRTPAETVRCTEVEGHEVDPFEPSHHHGVATQLKRHVVHVTWTVNRHGKAVLLSPDNLVEVC